MELENLIDIACPVLREIVFHSDGRVIAKTGGKAKYPKRLYTGRKGMIWSEKTREALTKLIKENI